jgi:inositol-phosphate phosphatase/L-galactose 1-phosphate phosphatase/histidinol-phosphatase
MPPVRDVPSTPSLLAFMNKLCDLSEAVIRTHGKKSLATEHKEDATPATEIDRRIEHALRKEISKQYPDHTIVGEEYGTQKGSSPFSWIIDPIDGTLAFMARRPIYGTLICFSTHGVPHIGTMNQPEQQKRWTGINGKKTLCNGAVVRSSALPDLGKALLGTTSPDYFDAHEAEAFRRLSRACRYTIYGGNCYDFAMLAQGDLDVVAEAGLKPYDVAALIPIVKSAGGTITDWQGNGLSLESPRMNVLAAANLKLHGQALEALRG